MVFQGEPGGSGDLPRRRRPGEPGGVSAARDSHHLPFPGEGMTTDGQLDADGACALFGELSDRLAAAGVSAQLFVVGGAAMALAYDADRLTRDVDALFVPAPEVRRIAAEMSGPHGLELDWLNDAAKVR